MKWAADTVWGQLYLLIKWKFHQVLRAKHGPGAFQSNLMRVKENSFRYLIYGAFGGNLITIKPVEVPGSAKKGSL